MLRREGHHDSPAVRRNPGPHAGDRFDLRLTHADSAARMGSHEGAGQQRPVEAIVARITILRLCGIHPNVFRPDRQERGAIRHSLREARVHPEGANFGECRDSMPRRRNEVDSAKESCGPVGAWTLKQLRQVRIIRDGDLKILWTPGQNSIHDEKGISRGRDVGNVVVQRDGVDVPYDVTFAFAHRAFNGINAVIHD